MIYIKKLKKNEKIKTEAVEVLPGGKDIMVPHIFIANYCLMPMARIIPKTRRPDPIEMSILLKKLYQRKTETYSEGIYSFARKGREKRKPGESYYSYLKKEVDTLSMLTSVKDKYLELEQLSRGMWETGYDHYKDTFFWSYHFLHGDLHIGNIVTFRGKYRLIDWENLRSGPKEIEIAFYLCWEYLTDGEKYRPLVDMMEEIEVFVEKKVISDKERDRILYCMIPLWMLIMVIYLNNGSLRLENERKKACESIIPLYKQMIFENRPWR